MVDINVYRSNIVSPSYIWGTFLPNGILSVQFDNLIAKVPYILLLSKFPFASYPLNILLPKSFPSIRSFVLFYISIKSYFFKKHICLEI